MPRPLHAVQEFYMTFLLRERYCFVIDEDGKEISNLSNTLCAVSTHSKGCSYWKGNYALLSVQFTSNGISSILGIPQKLLINNMFALDSILGDDNRLLTEQLSECGTVYKMSHILNSYFTRKLLQQSHKSYTNTIATISHRILLQKGLVNLDQVVQDSNMSFRNFERRFVDEVGISPKMYARITRFFNAIENKMLHQHKSWTAITYEGGYYDQAHFIRECKEFSDNTPEKLFELTPPPKESITSG